MAGVLINLIILEQIVRVLVADGHTEPAIQVGGVVSENTVLDTPAEEEAVLRIVVTGVALN